MKIIKKKKTDRQETILPSFLSIHNSVRIQRNADKSSFSKVFLENKNRWAYFLLYAVNGVTNPNSKCVTEAGK